MSEDYEPEASRVRAALTRAREAHEEVAALLRVRAADLRFAAGCLDLEAFRLAEIDPELARRGLLRMADEFTDRAGPGAAVEPTPSDPRRSWGPQEVALRLRSEDRTLRNLERRTAEALDSAIAGAEASRRHDWIPGAEPGPWKAIQAECRALRRSYRRMAGRSG